MKKVHFDGRQMTFDLTVRIAGLDENRVYGPVIELSDLAKSQMNCVAPSGLTVTYGSCSGASMVTAASARVVPFVDAATMTLRRNALRRVISAGIFSVGPNKR